MTATEALSNFPEITFADFMAGASLAYLVPAGYAVANVRSWMGEPTLCQRINVDLPWMNDPRSDDELHQFFATIRDTTTSNIGA